MSAATVMMHATDAAAWMAGAQLAGPDAAILRVTTDSRSVQPGDLLIDKSAVPCFVEPRRAAIISASRALPLWSSSFAAL